METPQLENGYIMIAMSVWEALGKIRLGAEELSIINCVIRKTWGFHKKQDIISLTQFEEYTGMKHANIVRTIKRLVARQLLGSSRTATPVGKTYWFNKHFDEWQGSSRTATPVSKPHLGGIKSAKKVVAVQLPTKDKTKDNITKDIYKSSFLNFLSKFNEITNSSYKETPLRYQKYKLRLKTYTAEQILNALSILAQDKFYLGENDRNWKADPDFFLRSDEQIDKFLNKPKKFRY